MDKYVYKKLTERFGGAGQALKTALEFFFKVLDEIDDRQITEKWIDHFNKQADQILKKQSDG